MLDGRIIGGDPVAITNHPYQLSLQYFGSHICGASLLSNNIAITAAHCVKKCVNVINIIMYILYILMKILRYINSLFISIAVTPYLIILFMPEVLT